MISHDDSEDTTLVFGILQAFVISVMMYAIIVRFLVWTDTQPVVVEQDTPLSSYPYNGN